MMIQWMRWAAFSVVVAVQACSAGAADPTPATVSKENFHLFILAGQSNMVGVGKVSEADRTPDPRIYMLNARKEWVPAVDPLHFVDEKRAGTGLGKTFAISYAKDHPGILVGLIPCAVGGTPMAEWQRGALDERTQTHPWDDTMARSKAAMETGTLKGILWHQGEADASPARSVNYSQKLQDLVQRFRSDLYAPQVPFILGELGQFRKNAGTEPYERVIGAMRELSETDPACRFVSSENLTHIGDRSHFNAASLREFGRRYYVAFRELELKENSQP